MVNKGIVTKVNGDTIAVKLYKSSSCSHCSCCSEANKTGSSFEFKINQKVELGDLVTLEISEKDVVKAAFIAYIFPPLLMILGYIVANYLGFSEMKSIIGSFIGLGVGFIFLAIYDKYFAKKTIDEEIKVVSVEKYDPNACSNLAESCEDFF
ncbi:SoxR reducing system RseC family protein [Fusobacterium simiae]|uniref:SoxR reducing system RseC family protein n=1 Tax=Fusobacterium simiae TaxID=855 RepID=A0ABT4DFT2_FUSSI|nr:MULTISPECIES: SoxR reducing system RseC family protein [Fusobacterium]MCY7007450.1 SoxR reducing system RseC family protein [Fusobacterium simiae]MDC7955913.1 SoxR reducing system RseC family protein [Fusobacterium simiae]